MRLRQYVYDCVNTYTTQLMGRKHTKAGNLQASVCFTTLVQTLRKLLQLLGLVADESAYKARDITNMAAPVFVFDNMRTRSNLFHRWISTSPEVVPIHHPFSVAAFLGPERFTRAVRAPEEQRKEYEAMMAPFFVEETYEEGTGKFVDAVGEARDVVGRTSGVSELKGHRTDPMFGRERSRSQRTTRS